MGPVSETLLIKHFPIELSDDDKAEFLSKCGAVSVKILSSKHNRNNIVFAKFPTTILAKQALHKLHQQEILGSYLTVEFAKNLDQATDFNVFQNNSKLNFQKINESGSEALLQRFVDKLNSWTNGSDFRSPVPSNLRYHYPPPTKTILDNICHQMITVPRFYTQVLHLMNRMNLQCPFVVNAPKTKSTISGNTTKDIPVLNESACAVGENETSGSESELSSDEAPTIKETIPNLKPTVKANIVKRPKVGKQIIIAPTANSRKTKFSEVFEDSKTVIEPKKTKLIGECGEKPFIGSPANSSGFGFLAPVMKEENIVVEQVSTRNEMEEERLDKEAVVCITSEALAANRIPEKDRKVLPIFKNYAEGAPICRLYVKNLAKQTSVEDLKFIFSRYLDEETTKNEQFNIRLMQEGRMKGQAFITLPTVDLAKQALIETNGFILNDKPMVVQFARSALS